jgi:polyisoprenoid-binding protein YceI
MSGKHTWAVVVGVLVSVPAFAGAVKTGEAVASFSCKGPAGFKLEGKATALDLVDDGKAMKVVLPLSTLKTGIDLRDKHMREKYLEVEKYPDAVLEVPAEAISLPPDGQSVSGHANGKLHLHGKTKDVVFTYTVKRAGAIYSVDAQLPLNMKDYDINIPSYLGITLQPDVQTNVVFQFTRT